MLMRRLAFLLLAALSARAAVDGPLSPEAALRAFRLEPGLRIELVAAEPTVVDPVALAFDERGRLFVAENRGYPTTSDPPRGIIAMLEDMDGDGRFEKRTVFAEGLTFPNGVMPWQGGLLVTCAPDLLFLQDTNHDGRADVREVLFTGFDASNTTQLRVSHPSLSIDNWIYLTSGLVSGKIKRPGATNVLEIKADFRFRPDLRQWQAAEGRAQFGLTFDDFGHRFICMNRVHVQHVVMPARYLNRPASAALLALIEPVQDCPETMEAEPLPGHRAAARIYPISDNITTADSHAGTFTSACGVTVYRGTALPPSFRGSVLACDPAGNLVHRDRLIASGSTFVARANGTTNEFLASPDNWFRPVFLANGPDGAIYVCDMYRKTIEHPQYLPDEMRKRVDFESGKDKGRIYRVTTERVGVSASPPRPDPSGEGPSAGTQAKTTTRRFAFPNTSTATLVPLLQHEDGWWRDTAHRLLLERRDIAAIPQLKQLAKSAASPPALAHALNLLDDFGALDDSILSAALKNPHSGVREQALRLSESRLSGDIFQAVLAKADDPDPRVRFQCAASLGETSRPETTEALVKIAMRDTNDRWTRTAILSSLNRHGELFLEKFVISARAGAPDGSAELLRELGRLLGYSSKTGRPSPSLVSIVTNSANAELTLPFIAGWSDETSVPLIGTNAALFARAVKIAADPARSISWRVAAVQALRQATFSDAGPVLLQCLDPHQPQLLQSAAVRSLTRMPEEEGAAHLLESTHWRSFPPATRAGVIANVLNERRHWPLLLAAIESKTIPASVLTRSQRKQLLEVKDRELRERAAKLLELGATTDRMKVFADYKSVLTLQPDPAHGRSVFKQHCAACHRLDREGVPVGPDLFGIRNQEREVILLHIIVPEYEIVPGYTAYRLRLKDGRELEGMIASESDTHVRLRRALGEEESIPRHQIDTMESSGLSLMPQELEKNMTRQDMADLIAYLKGM
jgi:putative membrane-bound dehydrogenase-like protein